MKWAKLALLLAFIAVATAIVQFYGVSSFTHEQIVLELDAMGAWSRVAFVLGYALLITLTVPGTALTVFGATFFGLAEAYILVLVGAMLGASLSFGIGRLLGREAIGSLLSRGGMFEKILAITQSFEQKGILAVAYLRMAYVPFVVLNYLAPLTGIRYRDFVIGTFLGILPGTFVFVFMGNTLQAAWNSGDWSSLISWQGAATIGLFLASLGLPWLAGKVFRGQKESDF